MTEYGWMVMFRNDRQGFVKQYRVEALTHEQAIRYGEDELVRHGYNRENFELVKLERLREVDT